VAGTSAREPAGPLRLAADVTAHDGAARWSADGALLGGTLKTRGHVDRERPAEADVTILLAIPRQELAGYLWGPVRVDAQANPGTSPRLDAELSIPGVRVTAKDRGANTLGVLARLAMTDLGLTGRALRALTRSDVPDLGGRGTLEFATETRERESPPRFAADAKARFDDLRFGDTVIHRLSMAGQVRDLDVDANVEVAARARLDVNLAARLDGDRKGLTLRDLDIRFPGGRWTTQGKAHIRADERVTSISDFRLASGEQSLSVDGWRRGEDVDATVKLRELRLGRLPAALVDPALRLDGQIDADVKVTGETDAPRVDARVEVRDAGYQGFSKLAAHLVATLEDDDVTASVAVEAPYLVADVRLEADTDALELGTPIDLRAEVKRLDIGEVMRAAEVKPLGDGRLTLKLRATGSARDPKLDLTMEAAELSVKPVPRRPVDVGRARVHVTYADRAARAELDFKSAHGGTLAVDANTRVDLSYPRVTRRPIVAAKLPIKGKVVARNLDVSWLAAFNPRVESMGGKVTADARLAGTAGDPQFVGDVRWKQGEVVATPPPESR
jgi:autotransporter translocation and assembly factor TamB